MTARELHPFIHRYPDYAERFFARQETDKAFALLALRYAKLALEQQCSADASEHAKIERELLAALKPQGSCCGGCGGGH